MVTLVPGPLISASVASQHSHTCLRDLDTTPAGPDHSFNRHRAAREPVDNLEAVGGPCKQEGHRVGNFYSQDLHSRVT